MAADRAINLPLRVQGIGEVERDFKRVGKSGAEGFEQVKKAANGANQEVSEYTSRLRRAADAAKRAFDRSPDVIAARLEDPAGYRGAKSQFVLDAVNREKNAISEGLPETTQGLEDLWKAGEMAGASLSRLIPIGAAVALGMKALYDTWREGADLLIEHEAAVSRFEAELSLLGNRSQATGEQIRKMADNIVRSTLQTEEAALEGARALASVSGLTKSAFEEALKSSAAYADAVGTTLPDVLNERTIPALQAVAARDIPSLIKAMGDLNDTLQVNVLKLVEAGKTAEAQEALFNALRDAAGDGPSGLALATDRLNKSWERLKLTFAESTADEAASGIDALAGRVDAATGFIERMQGKWVALLSTLSQPLPVQALNLYRLISGAQSGAQRAAHASGYGEDDANRSYYTSSSADFIESITGSSAKAQLEAFKKRYADNGPKKGSGGRSGLSESERLKREAEAARSSADRIIESNQDVIDDYARRAREASEKIGLEGEALAEVERRHEIEAAIRRLNTDLIEKEMDARRKAAAAEGKAFDEARNLAEVTKLVDGQKEAVRGYAESLADTNAELAEFSLRQAQAKAVIAATRTPMEAFNDDLETYINLLRQGHIDSDTFDRMMDRMAARMADIRYELDETAQSWAGFGDDVGRMLVDIGLNGGKAIDILRELIRLPLERLLQSQIGDPVANFIDSLTGNNRDKNIADARGNLPDAQRILGASVQVIDPAAQGAAASLTEVQTQGYAAAQALGYVGNTLGLPVDTLAIKTDQAALAMSNLTPETARFGSTLAQVISMLSSGGGGGNGFLGLAKLALGAFAGGGPTAAGVASLTPSVLDTINANPALFASGTDRVPTGKPFWVGENGRELMMRERSGDLRVLSNQQAHRVVTERAAMPTVQVSVNVPERANPRRTASHVSRGVQSGIERAARKGLARGRG